MRREFVVADISLAVAAVSLAAGLWLMLRAAPSARDLTARDMTARVF